jgi:nicotinamidase-related amidase
MESNAMKNINVNYNSALLVIDIQNDYFPDGLNEMYGSEKVAGKAKNIIEKFKKNNLEVIYVQHIASNSDAKYFKPDTNGINFYHLIKPESNEKIIIKNKLSSFQDTTLLDHIKTKKIQNLFIIGMQTNLCVTKAVEESLANGINVIVIEDICTAKTYEIHDAQIEKLKGMAEVINYENSKFFF